MSVKIVLQGSSKRYSYVHMLECALDSVLKSGKNTKPNSRLPEIFVRADVKRYF
jgi:hypothetical protein